MSRLHCHHLVCTRNLCSIDILHQLQAVKSALARAEDEILKKHASHCVAEAIASGDTRKQHTKVEELVNLFAKAKR